MSSLSIRHWARALGAVVLWPCMAFGAAPASVSGTAHAIGPDIIMVSGTRVILLGIDAPEDGQTCRDGANVWRCGDTAFAVLDQIVKAGPVSCTFYGRPDPFHRYGGVCTVGGKDVAKQMVLKGMALVYTHDKQSANYVAAQKKAQAAHVGLWKKGVSFMKPWEYRQSHHPGGFK